MSHKRALCVGIDQYAPPDDLSGCVNDTRAWAQTLADLGFEFDTLTDQAATRAGMLDALGKLVGGAERGDVLVFQYSGHGTQVTDLDGDEDDNLDEALCPVDIDDGAFLIDDDLWDVLGGLADGVSLTVIFDCCHSGSATRTLGSRTAAPRAPDAKRRFIRPSSERNAAHEKYRGKMGSSRVQRPAEEMNWINFSACQPHEVAWEHGGQGDFTRHGTAVLRAGAAGLTNEAFQQKVVAAFGPNPAQRPYLDCRPEAFGQSLFGAAPARGLARADSTGGADSTRDDLASLFEVVARLLRSGGP